MRLNLVTRSKVGQCLGFLCDRDEAVPTVRSSDTNESHDGQASDPVVPVKSQDVAANNANKNGGAPTQVAFDETPATPSARRLARKLGVDIRQLAGTDHGNPITEKEVRAVAKTPVYDSQGESGNDLERLPRRAVSPRAAARAVQLGIGLSGIVGTGRGGNSRTRRLGGYPEDCHAANSSAALHATVGCSTLGRFTRSPCLKERFVC